MSPRLLNLIIGAILSLFCMPFSGHAQSLSELDRIQDQASDFHSFAHNSKLRQQYFHALQAYFAKPITQKNFDGILNQLNHDPKIAKDLWNKVPLGPVISLEAPQNADAHFDLLKWQDFVQETTTALQEEAGTWSNWWAFPAMKNRFIQEVEKTDQELIVFFRESSRTQEEWNQAFEKHKALVAGLLLYQIDQHKSVLQGQSWSKISEFLKQLPKHDGMNWNGLFFGNPKLGRFVKMIAPKFVYAADDRQEFDSKQAQESDSIDIRGARPLHAMFRSLLSKDSSSLTAPLKSSMWIQFVEIGGKASAVLPSTLITTPQGTVAVSDLSSDKWSSEIVTSEGRSTLFELWLKKGAGQMPKGVQGPAVATDTSVEFIRSQFAFRLGIDIDSHTRLLNPSVSARKAPTDAELVQLWNTEGVNRIQILQLASQGAQTQIARKHRDQFFKALQGTKLSISNANAYLDYLAKGKPLSQDAVEVLKQVPACKLGHLLTDAR